ncbi:hypothetical protein [Peribacillus acanthi]|uniref:hypothetical protein n=1 Tax=Peribacillus acanthi TaxID=2171554 RepID=UPI0013006A80|nr:hypothetical protein [Peribacillus acanthi]
MTNKKEEREDGFLKGVLYEIRDSIIFQIVYSILSFIPRMLFRLVRGLFSIFDDWF